MLLNVVLSCLLLFRLFFVVFIKLGCCRSVQGEADSFGVLQGCKILELVFLTCCHVFGCLNCSDGCVFVLSCFRSCSLFWVVQVVGLFKLHWVDQFVLGCIRCL